MNEPVCPNEKAILKRARDLGIIKPRIRYDVLGGWEILGKGRGNGGRGRDGWPRIWRVVEKMGINFGCGNGDQHQIDPTKFDPNK